MTIYRKLKASRVSDWRKLNTLLFIAALGIISVFGAVHYSQAKVADFIYSQYTEPFLAHTPYIVQR